MAERILAYKLRTKFSADMQLSQNHIANYGASFKAQKVLLPLLKYSALVQICLVYQLSRQQIQFFKIWHCHFLVYVAKYPHVKNQEHPLSRS